MTTFDESSAVKAFSRDDGRVAPHNLFTSTKPLWAKGSSVAEGEPAPASPFVFDGEVTKPNKKARSATIVFSGLATAEWRWSNGHWVRFLDGSPMMLEHGAPISADNVVIQVVKTTESEFTDVAGFASPEVDLIGKGRAWVLRDGRLIAYKVRRFPKPLNPGHRPFDGRSDQTMTNASVGTVVASAGGRELTMTYEGGAQKIEVPESASVSALVPGNRGHLVPGAPVSLTHDANRVAQRIQVGRPKPSIFAIG